MRTRFLRLAAPFAVVVLVLPGCGSSGDDAADTTLAATTTAAETTTTTAVTTTTVATTTTQPPATTTTELESVFAAPEVYEPVALDYCAQWPDVEAMLTDDANYAEVPGDGLTVPEANGFSKGVSAAVS